MKPLITDHPTTRGAFGSYAGGRPARKHHGSGWLKKLHRRTGLGPGDATATHRITFADGTVHLRLSNGQHVLEDRRARARRAAA